MFYLELIGYIGCLFLFMSSGNYGGISWDKLVKSFSVKK